jgi:hypothetical protein
LILRGIIGKLDCGLERQAIRACNFQTKFSRVTLRQERKSEQGKSEVEPRAHLSGNLYAISFTAGFELRMERATSEFKFVNAGIAGMDAVLQITDKDLTNRAPRLGRITL